MSSYTIVVSIYLQTVFNCIILLFTQCLTFSFLFLLTSTCYPDVSVYIYRLMCLACCLYRSQVLLSIFPSLICMSKILWPYSAALLHQYFSTNQHCFTLTAFQHKHHHKLNFSETNRVIDEFSYKLLQYIV